MKLLQELFANGILSESRRDELKKEIEKTGKKEEEVILENKIISENALFELKSKILRIPLKIIKPADVPSDILDLIPEEASINYKMTAFSKTDNSVQIAMVYPEDASAQNALRFLANQEKFNYQVYLISPSNFVKLQSQRRTLKSETKKALEELGEEKDSILNVFNKEANAKQIIAEDAPVIRMVLVILRHAIEANASDIHIEPSRDKLNVRFRLNGVLKSSLLLPLKVHPSIVARIKILAGLKIDENRVPQDGRFSAKINDKDIDFRVATFPILYGEKIELRVLDPSTGSRSFDELGLSGRNLEVIKEAIKKPYGLILFTGPTGSGKTTTQYAILRILNQETVNIVTLEDPIEYSIAGINQSQTKPEIGYTFASGLRQILRQDPNIIMVGEIRDEETASLVMNAALTGHVVLSTLHTNSSVGVVARLVDMGVKPFLIPSTLRIVISQRLIRVLCPACKVKVKPNEKVRDYILDKIKSLPASSKEKFKMPDPFFIYETKGCEKCNNTGYSGRAGLYEVLSMNDEIAELVLKNPTEHAIFEAAQRQGMITMEQEGVLKIIAGETTIEEVARVTTER
jgi:type IV pilus assembly protein PilB